MQNNLVDRFNSIDITDYMDSDKFFDWGRLRYA